MLRILLKSKIHRTAVTRCDLNHEGSCVIDEAQRVVMTPDNRIAGQRSAIPAQQP
jgi:aspartate 1-decarboxylase